MNGFLLLIPFFLIRFGLLALLNKKAILRAARFPPCCGKEKIAYWVYQVSNVAIFVMLLFLSVPLSISRQAIAGWIGYSAGLLLCTVSVIHFAFPAPNGLNTQRYLPFFPQPHVPFLFHLFSESLPFNPVLGFVWHGNGLSGFCALDYPGGRTMVFGNLWR